MEADDIKQSLEGTLPSNQILRLLDALPGGLSRRLEARIRETFKMKWFQTWRKPEYDPSKLRASDMKEMMVILDVPEAFFLGTEEEANDIIRRKVVENQFTGVTV